MSTNPDDDLAATLQRHIARWPGSAGAWAQLATGASASAGVQDLPFAWASVTKLLVALACLVAVEKGTADLDGAAGPPGSTLAHLLAHASGLPLEGNAPIAPPARRRIYSNTGIEMAASRISAGAGMPFEEYLAGQVLRPLRMSSTVLVGSPASGASGPLSDLALLARELASPTLVRPSTWERATGTAWPHLVGVVPGFGRQNPCDWGLGPEIRGHKAPHWTGSLNSPRTYGHFGQSGAFLWVDPEAQVALAGLCTRTFGAWAKKAWPALSDDVLAISGGDSNLVLPPTWLLRKRL